jgi:hypothetical protein
MNKQRLLEVDAYMNLTLAPTGESPLAEILKNFIKSVKI